MAETLRVIPTQIYERLVKEGILEMELLRDKLGPSQASPLGENSSIQNKHSVDENSSSLNILQETNSDSDKLKQTGKGKRDQCPWVVFDQKFQLKK